MKTNSYFFLKAFKTRYPIILKKYIKALAFPIIANRLVTGLLPIQVKKTKFVKNLENKSFLNHWVLWLINSLKNDKKNIINKDINKRITPNSLFGTDRRIA